MMVHRKSRFEATLLALVDIAELGGGVEYQSIDWAVAQPRFEMRRSFNRSLHPRFAGCVQNRATECGRASACVGGAIGFFSLKIL